MKRKFLALLLSAVLVNTSVGSLVYAAETPREEVSIEAEQEIPEEAAEENEMPVEEDVLSEEEEIPVQEEELSAIAADMDEEMTSEMLLPEPIRPEGLEIPPFAEAEVRDELVSSPQELLSGTEEYVEAGQSDIQFSYDEATDTLTLSGSGSTMDCVNNYDTPWIQYKDTARHLVVEEGIKRLGNLIFYQFSQLETVDFPKGLLEIGDGTFAVCMSLKEVNLPESVTYIGILAFGQNTALESITFPSNTELIYQQAFYNCDNLKSVHLNNGLEQIGAAVFYNTAIEEVTLPTSVHYVGMDAFPEDAQVNIKNKSLNKLVDGTYQIPAKLSMKATFDYKASFEVLNLVNKQRKSRNLPALKMDKELLEAAMIRAAEQSLYFDHTRPNGTMCYSASSKMKGENVAAFSLTPEMAMASWMASQGHKENILQKSYKIVGVGAVVVNGQHYWAQCFGSEKAKTVSASQYKNQTKVAKLEICAPSASMGFRLVPDGTSKLKVGETGKVTMSVFNSVTLTPVESKYLQFLSSNPKICTISSKGTLKGINPGKIFIAVSVKGSRTVTALYEVTVLAPSLGKVAWTKCAKVSGGVSLQWKKVSNAKGYKVYRYDDDKWKKIATTKSTKMVDKNIKKGQQYKYRIRAYCIAGETEVHGKYSVTKTVKY